MTLETGSPRPVRCGLSISVILASAALGWAGCGEATTGVSSQANVPLTANRAVATASSPGGSAKVPTKRAAPKPATSMQKAAPPTPAASHGAGPRQTLPAATLAKLPVTDLTVSSAALNSRGGELSSRYTCDGSNTPPPLQWSRTPPGTVELMVFVLSLEPVKGELFFDWALANLPANTSVLQSGALPPGAVSGRNSFGRSGYSICPPAGAAEHYAITVYALPQHLGLHAGFDPQSARARALQLARHTGLLVASYRRK
jgi:phosphatidylethanolamine-binding protein (PEBP) family uncharacterized protein